MQHSYILMIKLVFKRSGTIVTLITPGLIFIVDSHHHEHLVKVFKFRRAWAGY